MLCALRNFIYFCAGFRKNTAILAQLVEQRIRNA